jgi:diguanylate cyclase (GGDEF)-like protein
MSAVSQVIPPVIGWRGFHSELRAAAIAATRAGTPLSLLILELAGLPEIRRCHGAAVAGGLVRALVGLLEAELGAAVALARYTEDRVCIIMPGIDLAAALARAERIGDLLRPARSLGAAAAALDLRPAIGIAQFADDEALGHLIERALEALAQARAAEPPAVVAAPAPQSRSPRSARTGALPGLSASSRDPA